jgi:hypothetical protein
MRGTLRPLAALAMLALIVGGLWERICRHGQQHRHKRRQQHRRHS